MEIENVQADNLLIRDMNFQSKEEVLESVGKNLFDRGYVRSTFSKGILGREEVYPTGLPVGKINVAIPHTDAEHVIKPAMVVVILDNPIEFHVMGDNEKTVKVDIMFVLALKSPNSQLTTLQELMGLIQDEDKLARIKSVKTVLELNEVLST